MLYAIFYNNNLIGLFNDYKKSQIAIDGLVENKFINKNKIVIKTFYDNSFTTCKNEEIEQLPETKIINNENNSLTTDSKEIIDMKKKTELEYELNELKKKKAKLEESKNVYNVDIELFNKFKKLKLENNDFMIPEMFIDKYNLMFELEKENKLSWENFNDLYEHKQVETSFSKLFMS
jgi:hypothetical protein